MDVVSSARAADQSAPGPIKALHLKRILVPIDFSESSLRALDYALALGTKFGGTVTLLHVVEPTIVPQTKLAVPLAVDEANHNLVESKRERLAEIAANKLTPVLATEQLLVRLGHAHSEIIDTAKALGVDIIVMGTHGSAGVKYVALGGTAERIVRQASCPVLSIGSQTSGAAEAR